MLMWDLFTVANPDQCMISMFAQSVVMMEL